MIKSVLKKIIKNKARSLYPSPSKMFLLRMLRRFLSNYKKVPVALDVAAADLKYRYFFEVKRYIGIDKDASLIEKGRKRYPNDDTIGVAADFFDIAKLPQIADIVVSTHTLAHLDRKRWPQAIELLVQCTKSGGGAIL